MKRQKLIFVVDDDTVINTLVTRRFTSEGYLVESFRFGEECLKELQKSPDLIILDYNFEGDSGKRMNGMEIFDRIMEFDPKIPVIILSGQEKGELVLELTRKGIAGYVIKDSNLIENLFESSRELLKSDFGDYLKMKL